MVTPNFQFLIFHLHQHHKLGQKTLLRLKPKPRIQPLAPLPLKPSAGSAASLSSAWA
jgi:hypothetical protein